MDADKPRRRWFQKKKWWAAAALGLLALYPLSHGPYTYVLARQWVGKGGISPVLYDRLGTVYAPLAAVVQADLPGSGLLVAHSDWWWRLGRRHDIQSRGRTEP
jgi:hypothetical protein